MFVIIKWCGSLCAALSLIGCAMAFGPKFKPEASSRGEAMVYIYRMPSLSGSMLGATPAVFLDGAHVGTLKNGGYIPLEVSPGKHKITLQSTLFGKARGNVVGNIQFEIAEDETRYFEFMQVTTDYNRYGKTDVAQVKFHFLEAPENLALKKLLRTRLVD